MPARTTLRTTLLAAALAPAVGCGGGTNPAPDAAAEASADVASTDVANDIVTPPLDALADSDAPTPSDAGDESASDAPAPDAGPCGAQPAVTGVAYGSLTALSIAGDTGSTLGIFDPSVVYPAGASGGVMSYSSVPDQHSVFTRLAVSADQGASWTYFADANAPTAMTIDTTDTATCPGGQCATTVINEVSSLIIDPDDPDSSRRWKLFTHRYAVLSGDRLHYEWGHIARYTAPDPSGPWSSPVVTVGWPSSSSFSSSGAALNVSSDPNLSRCVLLSEPSAIWLPGVGIDLAVGCAHIVAGSVTIDIVRLRSTDHGDTFRYAGPLLSGSDASCFGVSDPRFNAANLFFSHGAEYLIATPESASTGYRGCVVFPVDDPGGNATLRRDGAGHPMAVQWLDTSPDARFTGACTYAEGASAMGYLMPVAFLTQRPVFRMFSTGIAGP